jgi:hypothetical protein
MLVYRFSTSNVTKMQFYVNPVIGEILFMKFCIFHLWWQCLRVRFNKSLRRSKMALAISLFLQPLVCLDNCLVLGLCNFGKMYRHGHMAHVQQRYSYSGFEIRLFNRIQIRVYLPLDHLCGINNPFSIETFIIELSLNLFVFFHSLKWPQHHSPCLQVW